MSSLRDALRRSVLYDLFGGIKQRMDLRRWESSGRPAPPPHLRKQQIVRELARQMGIEVLVETGTYLGDMVVAMRKHFREIYTVELSDSLYERARRKFDPWAHIHCLNGDSPGLLTSLLRRIGEPCLFWLDGHYSGPGTAGSHRPCPVVEELEVIAAHTVRRHAILIDDARLFTGQGGYPSLEELESLRARLLPGHVMRVEEDIIRLLPGGA